MWTCWAVSSLLPRALELDYNVHAVHHYPDAERVIGVISLHADVSFADSSVLHKSMGILSRLVKKLVHPEYEINKKNSLLFWPSDVIIGLRWSQMHLLSIKLKDELVRLSQELRHDWTVFLRNPLVPRSQQHHYCVNVYDVFTLLGSIFSRMFFFFFLHLSYSTIFVLFFYFSFSLFWHFFSS